MYKAVFIKFQSLKLQKIITQGFLLFIVSVFNVITCASQSAFLDYNHQGYTIVDRLNHLHNTFSQEHFSTRKIKMNALADNLKLIDTQSYSAIDQSDILYLKKELNDPELYTIENAGLWGLFYQNPAYLYQLKTEDFNINVNAFFNFSTGHEREEDKFIFLNKRGIEFWGDLDQKLYFYSAIHENQANFLNYIQTFINQYQTIPGQGHYKPYQSSLVSAFNGYDFANAKAYLGYQTSRHTNIELGHGNHFIGNGIRSLLLSDFSHNYFYFSFNVNVWKLNYQSIVSELNPISSRQTLGNTVLPKKYMATHYLSLKLNPKFEIGLFESVVFSRENQFEFQYLNPVILYRTVEALFDSPDNVLLGININWMMLPRTSVYSQLLIDELKTSEIFSGNDWWGNKWALQLGLKHFDLFNIDHLDLQFEYNKVRPFTYSHNTTVQGFSDFALSNYSHFNQPLAHPLGSNFSEVIFRLRYRPINRIYISTQYFYTKVGRNHSEFNFGRDILLNNESRSSNFGVKHIQGAESKITSLNVSLSYRILHDLFFDINLRFRTDDNAILGKTETNYTGVGLRYNIENNSIDY